MQELTQILDSFRVLEKVKDFLYVGDSLWVCLSPVEVYRSWCLPVSVFELAKVVFEKREDFFTSAEFSMLDKGESH